VRRLTAGARERQTEICRLKAAIRVFRDEFRRRKTCRSIIRRLISELKRTDSSRKSLGFLQSQGLSQFSSQFSAIHSQLVRSVTGFSSEIADNEELRVESFGFQILPIPKISDFAIALIHNALWHLVGDEERFTNRQRKT
jgi:hypothetical protein